MAEKKTNIVLTGFMGAGKTSVGKSLAREKSMGFIDTDDIIEKNSGISITEIFSRYGEVHFRTLESQAALEVSALKKHVIATGGGIVLSQENVDCLRLGGKMFYLKATPEVIWERVKHYQHRPLLQVQDPIGKIRALLSERESCYHRADCTIDTSHLTVEQVVAKIVEDLDGSGDFSLCEG